MVMRSNSTSIQHGRGGDAPLTLGVKGRLSNQEMQQLKHQLATAIAYDHIPEDQKRRTKQTSTPMTHVYHKLEPESTKTKSFRPSIKPQAAIEYEKKFTEGSYDAQRMRPAPRGISMSAKTVLQDEYVIRPREISVIPRNKHTEPEDVTIHFKAKDDVAGKRHAPAAIPQVFIM